MKLAFHWRIALWNLLIVGAAIVLFGIGPRLVIFSLLVLTLTALFVWRVRTQLSRPLEDLTDSVRKIDSDEYQMPAIPRGLPEVRGLVSALTEWHAEIETRVRDLSDARLRLESVLRAMDEGVLVFDSVGRIAMTNRALSLLLDVKRDVVGRTCLEVFRNEDLDDAVRKALDGHAVDAVEFQTYGSRVLRALVSSMGDGEVRRKAAVMVLEDLTDIRRVDRIRRDFVANVSHEFKTPLTSIRGYAETMISESEDPSHRDFADTIRRNARYLESLVNDLLVLARIEAEPPSVFEDVDIVSLINEQVSLRGKPPASERHNVQIDCPPIAFRADTGRLSIALSNLIDNAIRYNRPGGVIRISGRTERDAVVLDVSDQGYGIPSEELPRIFERFYRVDKARTRNAGGTGLGLAIARHAVESQGGTLTVVSHAGSGSTFTIRIPLRAEMVSEERE